MSALLEDSTSQVTRAPIGDLALERGGILRDVHIAYELRGADAAPVVLVLGGISAGRRLVAVDVPDPEPGWWPGVAGAGCALDPARYRLLSLDYVGGRGASTQPLDDEPWPAFTTADQAAVIDRLLGSLGIDTLHAAVGASYGGMVALALAERFPVRTARVVAIVAAHRAHPHATALRSVQRRIVRLGLATPAREDAVGIARALAMTTYRSRTEFVARFAREPLNDRNGVVFPVDGYLDHHARQYAATFPASSFLAMSQSLDLHAIDPGRIRAHCTIVATDSDTLVPPEDCRALAAALGERATFVCISTPYGHDGFLKEPVAIGATITAALNDCTATSQSAAGAPPPLDDSGSPTTHYAARSRADDTQRAPGTRAVSAGIGTDTQHGAVMPPIYLTSTFEFDHSGQRKYDYTRTGNPTRDVLAAAIAELEGGAAGIVTPTGMAAITVVLQLLRPGDLVIAAHDGYGGTYRLLRAFARKHAFEVAFVDLTAADAKAQIERRKPRMVWLETPSNPLLRITDIAGIAAAAHAAGALCVADNTFLSPVLQTPLTLGADIVVHSTTKYLNGHSDVVGGALVARDVALAEELGWWANCIGATGAPFDSYLTLRGLRTLHARMRVHEENARAVVDLLAAQPCVRRVYYPGLASHAGHDVAARQQRGFGGMVSFELHDACNVSPFLNALRIFTLAESLGGVESLIAHPATMTHAAMDPAARAAAGISDALLRLSVGIEAAEDLVADLARACASGGW